MPAFFGCIGTRKLRFNASEIAVLPTGIVEADVYNLVDFNAGNVSDKGTLGGGTSLAGNITYTDGRGGKYASGFSLTNAVILTRTALSSLTGTGMTLAAWVRGTNTSPTQQDYSVANNVFGDNTGYAQFHGYEIDDAYLFRKTLTAAQVAQLRTSTQ